jgi:hypothetical protein
MFSYTTTTLKKLEALLEALDYTIRYEKGNFQSGYCLVKDRKIAVINKFFITEARINSLIEIINTIDVDADRYELDEKQVKMLAQIKSKKQDGADEEAAKVGEAHLHVPK